MFSYTVTCEFDDEAVAREWIEWMRMAHLRDVCEAGALDGEVVVFDRGGTGGASAEAVKSREAASGGGVTCEVRYHFTDRAAFERYERDHAPRLRADGLGKFPLQRGLRYTRRTGEVACAM